MIDFFLKFQVNVFVNVSKILPEPSIISELLDIFKDNGFIPNTMHYIGPEGQTLRLRMSSPDNKWNVLFLPRNINIACDCGPDQGDNEMDSFLSIAKDITSKMLNFIGQKSNRLAFIVNVMLKEMKKAELESCYNKLFIPLPIYQSNSPFEWNNRSGTREEISLADTPEIVNIFTEIKRARGRLTFGDNLSLSDRIMIQYELNTNQENEETRFCEEHLEPFMNVAKENYNKIITDLEGVINA